MNRLCAEWTIASLRGALFLDRDGVIIKDNGYVNSVDRTEFIPECIEAIKIARNNGLYIFVVTNQAGVARELFTEAECRDFNLWLVRELASKGAVIDELVYCPSHPDFSTNLTRCNCRKPESGMLDYLIQKWNLSKENSLILGDRQSDFEAGIRAGIRAKLVTEPIDILSAVKDFVLKNEVIGKFDIKSSS